MDYTDKQSVRTFVKENDIRDLAQLDIVLKQITGVRRCLRLNEMTILATPDTIRLTRRQRTQGMVIDQRQFAHLMGR
jgi:hypothetical protein